MDAEKDYSTINKQSWNNRTETHLKSAFYDMEGFLQGNTSLNAIELGLLGDVSGKSVLHLQCHFGQDTLSLERLGATVTGVDLSDKAIANARKIAQDMNSQAQFICCDVYDLEQHLDQQFDLVFTSYGTITWLPDLDKWARLIARFLKPNGKLVFVEFHPVVWMFDDDFDTIRYSYFNKGPIVETENGTYADKEAAISQDYVVWNHSLSEVMGSLLQHGMVLHDFQEYEYSPYNCFNKVITVEPKNYAIAHLEGKIPMVYSIVAQKKP